MSQINTDFIPEVLEKKYKGEEVKPNYNNPLTKKRSKLSNAVANDEDSFSKCLAIVKKNKSRISKYVSAKGESPSNNPEELAVQAADLRYRDIMKVAETLEVPFNEAQIFIEDNESGYSTTNSSEADYFITDIAPAIFDVAETVKGSSDQFISPELVSGVLNTAGTKINASSLVRAAQNKPAGLLGTLSSGGTKLYNQLRAYFQKNPAIAKDVISGKITSIDQTGFYGSPEKIKADEDSAANDSRKFKASDVLDEVRKAETKRAIKKYLPFIIIGILAIIAVTFLIAKNANRK